MSLPRCRDSVGMPIGLVFAALLLVSTVCCTPRDVRPPGYYAGACRPTPVVERMDVGPGFAAPVRLVVAGDLAGHPLNHGKGNPTSMSPGNYWYIRDPQARPYITLRAERLDRAETVTFDASGYPLGKGFLSEWAPADWYYRTWVEALEILPVEGCWRITLVGGRDAEGLVYHLKKIDLPAR